MNTITLVPGNQTFEEPTVRLRYITKVTQIHDGIKTPIKVLQQEYRIIKVGKDFNDKHSYEWRDVPEEYES